MKNQKVYTVIIEWSHFECEDNNYAELQGVYANEKDAIKKVEELVKDELSSDMKLSDNDFDAKDVPAMLDAMGYVHLEQDYGWGETRISLNESKVL